MSRFDAAFLVLFVSFASLSSVAQTGKSPHPPTSGKKCLQCHEALGKKKVLHSPVNEQQCDSCHIVPAAGGLSKLSDQPESLCFTCHDKDSFLKGNVHGPVAVGGCLACHDPHSSDTPHLTRSSGPDLCFSCHEDMKARLAASPFRHKTVDSGCITCHSPHSSPQKFQLKAAAPDLCASCHKEVMAQAASSAVKHSAVTSGQACLTCHDPHVAQTRPQLRADGVATCLNCHDKAVTAGGAPLTDMKGLLAGNQDHHGPIRDKDCTGCHSPHGGPHFRLLKENYPKEFYAPFRESNFALCFGCHDSALPRDEKTTTLTDFRDGDRNLHFVHVNKTPKGRTCRACHETHASSSPNHIRKSVPFGAWSLPVNFAKSENGGTCSPGCHAPQTYDRKKLSTASAQ
ncbi:MAG: cytochrome C [Acidobacteria bacterium]|nr:cytochrome C [Acidobacteriota bacterium]